MTFRPIPARQFLLIASLLFWFAGCGQSEKEAEPKLSAGDQQVRDIVETEDQILALTKRLENVGLALEGIGQIGNVTTFAEEIDYLGLEADSFSTQFPDLVATSQNQPGLRVGLDVQSSSSTVPPKMIWKDLLERFALERCRFGILEGHFEGKDRFVMTVSIESPLKPISSQDSEDSAEPNESSTFGINAVQQLDWLKDKYDHWKITGWKQLSFTITGAGNSLFKDITATAIPDADTLKRVSRSSHSLKMVAHLQKGKVTLSDQHSAFSGYEDWPSAYQFPASSVVDYDGDGWEDVFIMDRWEPAILLRNQGDGTFKDVTKESGLIVKQFANCTLFADFDNDGDPDAFVCGTLGPSFYFENTGGKFKKVSTLSNCRYVVSASACDLNRDGWLDLYLCTYDGSRKDIAIDRDNPTPEQLKKVRGATSFIDRAGPANLIAMNRNGKFEFPSIDSTIQQFRNTYQATWSDVDDDGDADLYLCNDFSPDAFLRNDTEQNSFEVKFTDVSKEVFPDGIIGFGMGASWGDFNSDGKMDLYVSNMYSKAGKRIIKMTGDVDPRISIPSQGNFLFQREGKTFRQVAGAGDDQLKVAKVGWSYGGQFADFNNDGQLDLYVPSGFFTPPMLAETKEDL